MESNEEEGRSVPYSGGKLVEKLLEMAESYLTIESHPDLAYAYANEALLEMQSLSGNSGRAPSTTIPIVILDLYDIDTESEQKKKRAEKLRRQALYKLMPAKCRTDKATRLVEETNQKLRAPPEGRSSLLASAEEMLERLELAERLHSTPTTLLTIAKVHELAKRHALAYVYHAEAMAAMSGGGGENGGIHISGVLRCRMRLNEYSCLLKLGFNPGVLKVAPPHPDLNSLASAKVLEATPYYRVDRWPVGMRLHSMNLVYLESLQAPEFVRNDGRILQPVVPYTHLLTFLSHNVASIDSATFSIPIELSNESRTRQGCEFFHLLSADVVQKRLADCEELLFAGTFHHLSWGEVRRVLDSGVMKAKTVQFAMLWWISRLGEPTDADPFLELSTVRACNCLTFDRSSAMKLTIKTRDDDLVHYYDYDDADQRLVRPLFSNAAVLAWLKPRRDGVGEEKRSIGISCSQLREGVDTFVRALFEDFHGTSSPSPPPPSSNMAERGSSTQLDGGWKRCCFSIALDVFEAKRSIAYECLRELGALPDCEDYKQPTKVLMNRWGERMSVCVKRREVKEIFTRECFDVIKFVRDSEHSS